MIKNDVKTALRNIKKHKSFSAINAGGLIIPQNRQAINQQYHPKNNDGRLHVERVFFYHTVK